MKYCVIFKSKAQIQVALNTLLPQSYIRGFMRLACSTIHEIFSSGVGVYSK